MKIAFYGLILTLQLTGCAYVNREVKSGKAVAFTPSVKAQIPIANPVSKTGARAVPRQTDARALNPVSLNLIDREKSLFRITNNSTKTIRLTSLFSPEENELFSARAVQHVIYREGKWLYVPYRINALAYIYTLPPGKNVTFELNLGQFDTLGVARGDLVKMCVDEFHSTPFRW